MIRNEDDPGFRRLPKWAQQRIETLERDVEWWKEKATPQIGNSNTAVKHGMDSLQCLGDSPRIEFKLGESWYETIECHLITHGGQECLRVSTAGGEGLYVHPSAANTVLIFQKEIRRAAQR